MKKEKIMSIEKETLQQATIYNISLEGNESFIANRILTHNTPPHAVSEKGVQSIQQWVKRKLGKRGAKESRRFADRIAWKIRKYGMDPHPFVRPAVDATAQKFKMVKITME